MGLHYLAFANLLFGGVLLLATACKPKVDEPWEPLDYFGVVMVFLYMATSAVLSIWVLMATCLNCGGR